MLVGTVGAALVFGEFTAEADIIPEIKLGDYNIGRAEQILTLPLYMAFLLKEV